VLHGYPRGHIGGGLSYTQTEQRLRRARRDVAVVKTTIVERAAVFLSLDAVGLARGLALLYWFGITDIRSDATSVRTSRALPNAEHELNYISRRQVIFG